MAARRPGVALAPPPELRGAALAAVAIVLLSSAQGGFFPSAWRAGAVGLTAAAVLAWLWTPARRPTRTTLGLLAVAALLVLVTAASAAWSVDASASLLDLQRTTLYLAALAAFTFAGDGLAVGVLAGATAVAAWALGVRVVEGAPIDPYEGRLLTGPIGYANGLGALLAVGAAVSAALALGARGWWRLVAAAPLVLLLPGLALTSSRAAWGACAAGIAVAAALHRGRRLLAALLVGGAAAALATLLVATPHRVGDRFAYWEAARAIGAAHPLAGAGAGTFHLLYRQAPAAHDAHSLYLQAFAELGAVGLILVVALLALPLATAVRRTAAAPAAGLVVYALHAGVDWDWQLPAVTVAALALAAAAGKDSVKDRIFRTSGGPADVSLQQDRGEHHHDVDCADEHPSDRAGARRALAGRGARARRLPL